MSTLRDMKRTPLKRGKPLKARHWRERWADRPDVYGELWEAARMLRCWGLGRVPGHRCRGRHTAHHDPAVGKGGTDETGLLPTCEALHARLENRSLMETRSELLERAGLTEGQVHRMAAGYVAKARQVLKSYEGLAR